jgi:nucleotide-binding universal stress UspA family protein
MISDWNSSPDATAPIFRIVHTTDFSGASEVAFAHALKLALVTRAELDLLHVSPQQGEPDWTKFPGVRRALHRWGLLPDEAPAAALRERGLRIGKIVTVDRDPVRSALDYIQGHPTELLVLATHQRDGIARWLHRATAEPVARQSGAMTLFLPEGARGFVAPETGTVALRRVLVPVDHAPAPQAAIDAADSLLNRLGSSGATARILHVGEARDMPEFRIPNPAVRHWDRVARPGLVVDEIVQVATSWNADLIIMTTEGHAGVLDALRGSTTERVLRRAPSAVLAVPAGSRAMQRLFARAT